MQKTVARLLEGKGTDVWSVAPDATVYEALELLAEKGIGALVVLDGDRLAGIVSERDYARKVVLRNLSSKDVHVSDIMTAGVHTVTLDNTTVECMTLMTDERIRHLPGRGGRPGCGCHLDRRRRALGDRRAKVSDRAARELHHQLKWSAAHIRA